MDKYGIVRPDVTPEDDQDHSEDFPSRELADHTTKAASDRAEAALARPPQKDSE